MIKREALNRPREFGGLGFLDVRVMNTCLLLKWIDKLERGDEILCCSLLRKTILGAEKHFPNQGQERLPILEISLEFQGVGTEKVVVLMLELAIKLDFGMNASQENVL